jgi:hypothetical protein
VPFWRDEEKRAREQGAQEEIDLKRKLTGARVQEISKGMLDGFGSSTRWRITKTGEETLAAGDAAAKMAAG